MGEAQIEETLHFHASWMNGDLVILKALLLEYRQHAYVAQTNRH